MKIPFNVKEVSDGYVISRRNGNYEQHSHLRSLDGVELLLRLIKRNTLPESEYLRESARRLLTRQEYAQLRMRIRRGSSYSFVNKYDKK